MSGASVGGFSAPPSSSSSAALATASLLSALLKDGVGASLIGVDSTSASSSPAVRLSLDDQFTACVVLATADWAADTTAQLAAKLKEKYSADGASDEHAAKQLDMTQELDHFHAVTAAALHILTQDLEAVCDPALTAMAKIRCVQSL